MYDSSVNNVVGCQQAEFLTASNMGRQFCVKCHGNNHLKVKLLAGFSPLNWVMKTIFVKTFIVHKWIKKQVNTTSLTPFHFGCESATL